MYANEEQGFEVAAPRGAARRGRVPRGITPRLVRGGWLIVSRLLIPVFMVN